MSSITCEKIQAPLMLKHPAPPKPRVFDFCSADEDTETTPPPLMLSHPAPPLPCDMPDALNSDSESEEAQSDEENIQHDNPLYETASKTRLKLLVSKSKVVDRMRKKFLNKKQTSFKNKIARSFIESGITAAPALSHLAASTLITCCINAFLIEIGVKIDPEKVAASCPGKDALN